jgi:hypothetical protein
MNPMKENQHEFCIYDGVDCTTADVLDSRDLPLSQGICEK